MPVDPDRALSDVLQAVAAMTTWQQPGDPLYDYEPSCRVTPILSDPCPPGCWHYGAPVGGHAMRWKAGAPVLRFLPDGLSVTDCGPDTDDMMLYGLSVRT